MECQIARSYIAAPTVFRSDFNNSARITVNQAWSLFFIAGRNDAALGANPELGQFFNNILVAVVSAVILGAYIFRSF